MFSIDSAKMWAFSLAALKRLSDKASDSPNLNGFTESWTFR